MLLPGGFLPDGFLKADTKAGPAGWIPACSSARHSHPIRANGNTTLNPNPSQSVEGEEKGECSSTRC